MYVKLLVIITLAGPAQYLITWSQMEGSILIVRWSCSWSSFHGLQLQKILLGFKWIELLTISCSWVELNHYPMFSLWIHWQWQETNPCSHCGYTEIDKKPRQKSKEEFASKKCTYQHSVVIVTLLPITNNGWIFVYSL